MIVAPFFISSPPLRCWLATSLRYVKRCDMAKARTIAFLVAAAINLVEHNDSALAQAQPCRSREYAHNAYTVCEVDLGKHTVRLYWKRSDGIGP
jgi:hypothetical protein